jgi:mono/diheme cytochrome c family protein
MAHALDRAARHGAYRHACPVLLAVLLASACTGGNRADGAADSALAVPGRDSGLRRDSSSVSTTTTMTTTTVTTATGSVTPTDSAVSARDSAPILLLAADSASGDSLYHNSRGRCITCHGPRGVGGGSLGPSLRDSVWLDIDGSPSGIASVIRDGVAEPKGGTARMPAFGRQLDATQISQIAVYVYSLSHRGVMARDSASARAASVRQ